MVAERDERLRSWVANSREIVTDLQETLETVDEDLVNRVGYKDLAGDISHGKR